MMHIDMLEAIGQMMDDKLEPINTRLTGLAEEQRHTRVLMEHMDKRMDTLAEGQVDMNEKFKMLDDLAERAEDIQITVDAMEAVIKQNSADIKKLRAVK